MRRALCIPGLQEGPDKVKPTQLGPHGSVDVCEDAVVVLSVSYQQLGAEGQTRSLQERNTESSTSGEIEP